MRRNGLIAGILFLVFSVTVAVTSWSMEYYSSIGPGPGFFPFWLSLILGLLSVIWIVQLLREGKGKRVDEKAEHFFPRGAGLVRVVAILGSLVVMFLLMEPLGFQLTMFAFLLFLLIALGKANPWVTLAVAVVGSFGLHYAFTTWLDVQLPLSSIQFLANIGL